MPKFVELSRRQSLVSGCALLVANAFPNAAWAADTLDKLVVEQMRRVNIPGLALGISKKGRASLCRSYGFADLASRRPATTRDMFHIASVSKTVVALALMRLVDGGRIVLDAPIAPFIDFAIFGDDAATITFRHLLMHTSGISDARYYEIDFRRRGEDASLSLRELLQAYLARGGRFVGTGNIKSRPGAVWDYSNIGFALLGYLGSRIVGRDFRGWTRDHIFEAIGLSHTAWSIAETPAHLRVTPYDLVDDKVVPVEPVGFPDWPAGMIRSSILDMTRLSAIVANHGSTDARRILSASSVGEMLNMQRPAGLPAWLTGQGLAWQQSPLNGNPLANHWGGDPGVFTMTYVDPGKRTAVTILSNMSATTGSRDALKAIVSAAFATV